MRRTTAALLLLAACAAEPAQVQTTLYLGRSMQAGGVVDDAAVESFVADTIARALPDGFTLVAATGGWRDLATGRTIVEPSLVLVVIHAPGRRGSVDAVAAAWMAQFGQQSVLRVEQPVRDVRF